MEKAAKKKMTAVAIATAVVLVLAGTIAWLADASGTLTSTWDANHVEVEITETGITQDGGADNGDKDYNILPGTEESKDPTIHVDAGTNAFVYAVVKDTVNSHGKTLVDYSIADGWVELDKTDLTSKELDKYVNIFTDKKTGKLTVDPTDENTKIYYRVVNVTDQDHRFDYPVLKDNKISYSGDLTNDDIALIKDLDDDQKALIFQTYAIQMQPFCAADATGEDLIKGAKDAWNQTKSVVPVPVTGVTVTPETLAMKVGDTSDPLTATVAPENATNKDVTWSSSNETVATVGENGAVTALAAGTATITATTVDGSKTDTCEVTVTESAVTGHIKYQVQLHSIDGDTATFWPATTNVYGKQTHDGDCICDCTWEEIVDGTHDFSNCHCTKTVTIDETSNPDIFNTLTSDKTSGMLYSSLKGDAKKWSTTGLNAEPTYPATLAAMKAGSDISGVTVSNFFLLSKSDAESLPESNRIAYDESGSVRAWWLATPYTHNDNMAYRVNEEGVVVTGGRVGGTLYGIAPGFSISK